MTVMSLRAVQRLCCAGLDSVSLRRAVAERLAPELGSDAWSFSTCDPDTGLMAHTVSEGLTPWLARQYVERLYPYEVARLSIDMLEMLQERTSGNLTGEEARFLTHVLTELRLNYVAELDEDKKQAAQPSNEPAPGVSGPAEPGA